MEPSIIYVQNTYELVKVKGQMGYIAARREKGSFVLKDETFGKKLLEVTPRKLIRVARPTQGWIITRQPALSERRAALLPQLKRGGTRAALSWTEND